MTEIHLKDRRILYFGPAEIKGEGKKITVIPFNNEKPLIEIEKTNNIQIFYPDER